MWTRAEAVEVAPQQRQELMRLAQGRNVAQKIALRARIILGASEGVDREQIRWLFADNPLGQGSEQTPVCLIRRVDAAR